MKKHDPLLAAIEAFLDKHLIGETIFGRDAAQDSHLVYDMRKGRKLRRPLRAKIESFMDEYGKPKKKASRA